MNNNSRYSFTSLRNQDSTMDRSDRFHAMSGRLSIGEILRSRSTISFDQRGPRDSSDFLRQSEHNMYGRNHMDGRYGHDSLRSDPDRSDLIAQNFRNSRENRLSQLYSERESLERERAYRLHTQNFHRPDGSGSSQGSFHRSWPVDTHLPNSHSPSVDPSLKEKFEHHMRREMLELSQELSPSMGQDSLYRNTHSSQAPSPGMGQHFSQAGGAMDSSFDGSSGRELISRTASPVWDKEGQIGESLRKDERNSLQEFQRREKNALPGLTLINQQTAYTENLGMGIREAPHFQSPISDASDLEIRKALLQSISPRNKYEMSTFQLGKKSEFSSPDVTASDAVFTTQTSLAVSNKIIGPPVKSQKDINNLAYSEDIKEKLESPGKNASELLPSTVLPSIEENNKFNLSLYKEDPAHSIPFLGETANTSYEKKASSGSQNETFLNQVKTGEDSNLSNSSHSKSGENDKIKSTLEDALETLMLEDPIVGLDYIIEYKDIVSSDGGFPFYCDLCKSSISRSLIIDHIKGYKHRLKYLKLKDDLKEEACDILNSLNTQMEKEACLLNFTKALEQMDGKGSVIVKLKCSEGKKPLQLRFGKVPRNACSPALDIEDSATLEPFTLSKIDEISQDYDNVVSSVHSKENSGSSHQSSSSLRKEPEQKGESGLLPKSDVQEEECTVVGTVTLPVVPQSDPISTSSNSSVGRKSLKRPASPLFDELASFNKVKVFKDSNPITEIIILEEDEPKGFDVSLLNKLAQCNISNEEEANMIRKVVNILLKLLLQFNLKHIVNEDKERLISEVQSRPLQIMGKLQELLKVDPDSHPGSEDGKLRLNSDFTIRGKNLVSNADSTPRPTIPQNPRNSFTGPSDNVSIATVPGPSRVQPSPIQYKDSSSYHKQPPLPCSFLGDKPPPPPEELPPPMPPPDQNLSLPPPPPPLPPELPLSQPPLPPSPSKGSPFPPLPPTPRVNQPLLPPPPMPQTPSSSLLPSPSYQLPNAYGQPKNSLMSVGNMGSVGGLMPHPFMPMAAGLLPDPTPGLLMNQASSLLPDPGFRSQRAPLRPPRHYSLRPPPPP